MLGATSEQDPDTLWLQDKHRTQNERVAGAADSGIGRVSSATARILQKVQKLSDVDAVSLSVGKCDMFNVVVSYNEKLVTLPKERDQWLVQMFVSAGFSKDDLIRLNRV